MRLSPRAGVIAAGTCTVLCLPAAAAQAGPDPDVASLRGSALVLFPPSPDDEVRFTVDAHARYGGPGPFPTESWGTARLSHHFTGPDLTIWYSIKVDCLITGGDTATVTGVIVDAAADGRPYIGQRIGFSVSDRGGRDRVGFTGATSPYPDDSAALRKCTAPAPFFTLRSGNYTVADTDHW